MKLPNCSQYNLTLTDTEMRKPLTLEGDSLVQGKECKDLKTVGEAMLVLHTYSKVHNYLHPMCYAGRAMWVHVQAKHPTTFT